VQKGDLMVTLKPVTLQATGVVGPANFAWQHLKAATLFRERVVALEAQHYGSSLGAFFEEIRAYASACIMSSVAAMEALINELYIAPNGRLRASIGDFEEKFWPRQTGIVWKPTLEKYQCALDRLGCARLAEGADPFQSAQLLVKLRNDLMHYQPPWENAGAFSVRFALSPFVDREAELLALRCMSAGCVTWAVETVVNFVRAFDTSAKLEPKKVRAFLELGAT
jgi:hypothetical protein